VPNPLLVFLQFLRVMAPSSSLLARGRPPAGCRLFAILGLLLVLASGGPPQSAAQETQVPLDPDSTLYTLDADLRQELGLFPEVDGFRRATLYRVSGDAYELVIEYREGGRTLRERRALTTEDVAALRRRVAERMQASGTRVGLDQEGRYDLLTATTFLGLAEAGLLVGASGTDDASAATTATLLGGAAGFFVPLLATRRAKVTEAAATLTGYGGVQGYLHAVELDVLFGGEADGRTVAGLAALLGAAEGTAGYVVGNRSGWSPGTGEMIAYNGLFGNGVGYSAGLLAVGGDFDDAGVDNDRARASTAAGLALLGSVGGAYAGHRLARTGYTAGDARIYANAGVAGTQLAGSILATADEVSPRAAAATTLSGFLAGATAGHLAVRDRDYTTTEGNLTVLGSFAGSLLGLAVTAGADSEDGTPQLLASSVGSLLGLGITAGVFAEDARRRAASEESAVNLQLQLTPKQLPPKRAAPAPQAPGSASRAERAVPRLTLRATF
jgi:hypothetical protein